MTYRPDILYHYTTQEGLIGILTEGVIRASSIQHLNDASEFHYAIKIGLGALNETELPTLVRDDLTLELKSCQFGWDVFVTSFSVDGDQLGQWRAYGKDGGYAIGFDSAELERLAVAQGYELRGCKYGVREQSTLVQDMLEKVGKTPNLPDMAPAASQFLKNFLDIAPTFKDYSFHAEAEWRLSKLQAGPMSGNLDQEIKYRPGKSFVVPYKEFKLKDEKSPLPLPIRSVMIGPTPHPDLSAWTVQNHLLRLGVKFGAVTIRPSVVPYRAW